MSFSLLLAMLAGAVTINQQSGSPSPDTQELAKQAVHVVINEQILNPQTLEPKSGKPLPSDGKWQVGNQRPDACPNNEVPCVRVFYKVPEFGVSCEWIVLLTDNMTHGKILKQNEDSNKYFASVVPKDGKDRLINPLIPPYPPIARAAHVSGDIWLWAFIDKTGNVINTEIVSGPEMLRASAIEGAKQWKFRPMVMGDTTIPFRTKICVRYTSTGRVFVNP